MNIQMSYLVLALVIFTMLALSFNQKGRSDLDTRLYHEAVAAATEMGDELLNEASTKAFDAFTVTGTVEDPTELTPPNSLGPSATEAAKGRKFFNDVDDYNGYKSIDSLGILGVCTTDVWVAYVNMDISVSKDESMYHLTNQTWYKKIVVEISSDSSQYLKDPIRLKYITSY